ncbi:MAG: hypothetical protein HOP23_11180 [Methylococcaceae bacterium]|nr:hypothetical protein [Methylococcaceae bacterium]
MQKPLRINTDQIIKILLLSSGTILALFLWQGHIGFSLRDEGFLWYGAQRVMLGEVPVRDFMSYDPGRYYWSATFMSLWGDNGIVALRAAVAIFQAIGLFIGLVLLARNSAKLSLTWMLLVESTLLVWMFPSHKLFDITLSIMLVGVLAFLIESPSIYRYFLAGMVVGLVAVFGRNHGVYGVLGGFGVMGYLAVRRESNAGLMEAFASWVVGVVIGYLPMLVLIAVVPDFTAAFWESILFVFEIKTVGLPIPVPWPWLVPFGKVTLVEALRAVLVGSFFIAIVAYSVLGIAWAVRQRIKNNHVSPVFVASAFMALPYVHCAFARADVAHLAQGVFPFLIGVFTLLASQHGKIRWFAGVLLCSASLLVMLTRYPGWQCYLSHRCIEVDVGMDKLKIDQRTANDLALLNKLAERFAPSGRSFIAAPFWPGAYAALERKSPMWEIYPLIPRSQAFQLAEIERIKVANSGFAIILDLTLDGREDLYFRNTHPMIEQYIRDNFEPLSGYTENPTYQIYISKMIPQ